MLIAAEKDLARSQSLSLKSFETQQNVDQQQAKVDQLKAAIAADEAAIESAQTQLDYTTIKAPSDGRVGIRRIDPGNVVRAADMRPITSLILSQPCAVLFILPATNLRDVREALKRGPVQVTALDQDGLVARPEPRPMGNTSHTPTDLTQPTGPLSLLAIPALAMLSLRWPKVPIYWFPK